MTAEFAPCGAPLIGTNCQKSAMERKIESLRASLTRVEEENAAIREAQHKLKSSVHYIAGFLEATARRHERGELSANEYTQRLTDCAVILLEANAGQHTARLSRATSAEGK